MQIERKKIDKNSIWAFGIGFLLALLSFLYFIVRDNGMFSLVDDFNEQQILFSMQAAEALRAGKFDWSWSTDLGTSLIGAYSFYNLGSPFFWILLLFEKAQYMYVMVWIYMLKYACASLFAYWFLRRFTKDNKYALLGALLYAFSGFQTTNLLFYHFHDVVAFFPLLLIGLDELVEKKRKGVFALAVFLNAMLNYFFFIGEVIFLLLYFFVRYVWTERGNWKQTVGRAVSCMAEGVIGVMLSGFLFLPSIMAVVNNPRAVNRLQGVEGLAYQTRKYLEILKAFFMPAEIMSSCSSLYEHEYSSCAAYLPVIGMVFVIGFMLHNKKSWLTRLLTICLVMTCIPYLNSIFTLLNARTYNRWYYMLILFMILASILAMEQRTDCEWKKPVGISALILCFLSAYIVFVPWSDEKENALYRPKLFLVYLLLAVLGLVATIVFLKLKNHKKAYRLLFTAVAVSCFVTTALAVHLYQSLSDYDTQELYDTIMAASELKLPEEGYRFDLDDNARVMAGSVAGKGSFCSTISGSIFDFYETLGLSRRVNALEGPEGTEELLSVRYYLTEEPKETEPLFTVSYGSKQYCVYEYENFCPIGFTYHSYLTESELEDIAKKNRALAMLQCLVVSDEDEKQVQEMLEHADAKQIEKALDKLEKQEKSQLAGELISAHGEEASSAFESSDQGAVFDLTAKQDTYVFVSIPYEEGFQCFVNGEQEEILESGGFMTFQVAKGYSRIELRYETPGRRTGIYLSGAGVFLYIIWLIWGWRHDKKNFDGRAETA